jgi:hypothetical protein
MISQLLATTRTVPNPISNNPNPPEQQREYFLLVSGMRTLSCDPILVSARNEAVCFQPALPCIVPSVELDHSHSLRSLDFLRLAPSVKEVELYFSLQMGAANQEAPELIRHPLEFPATETINLVTPDSVQQSNTMPPSPPALQLRHLEFAPPPSPPHNTLPTPQNPPPPPEPIVMIPVHVLHPEPEYSGPFRSTRLAEKTQGMYVSVLEKALKKKKKREEAAMAGASKSSKIGNSSTESAGDAESKSVPPLLTVDQLVRLGKDCGFSDKEEGELMEAASLVVNE